MVRIKCYCPTCMLYSKYCDHPKWIKVLDDRVVRKFCKICGEEGDFFDEMMIEIKKSIDNVIKFR